MIIFMIINTILFIINLDSFYPANIVMRVRDNEDI